MSIDPSAVIHRLAHVENASIGARTKVWQFASVIRGARIGEDCNIASCAIVDAAYIGNACIVGHGAQLHPGTLIGNAVFVGPGAIFCNDRWPSVSKEGLGGEGLLSGAEFTVIVHDGASIGAGAVVLPGVSIGVGALVAAGAVVPQSVPANFLYKRDGSMVRIGPIKNRMRRAA